MTKIEFCYELFRYISNGFTRLIFETNNLIYSFDFSEDDIFIAQEHFEIINVMLTDFKIKYSDVKTITVNNL